MLISLFFVAFCAYANLYRGASVWPAALVTEKIRSLLGFGIRPLIFSSIAVALGTALVSQDLIFGAFVGLTYIFIMVFGWGSYMEMGQNANSWNDDQENRAIDWILLKIFGPEWGFGEITRFDVVHSPTGEVRPEVWRMSRDFFGMVLRGSFILLPMSLITLYYDDVMPVYFGVLFSFLFGASYLTGVLAQKYTGFLNSTVIGEALAGAAFGVVVLMMV